MDPALVRRHLHRVVNNWLRSIIVTAFRASRSPDVFWSQGNKRTLRGERASLTASLPAGSVNQISVGPRSRSADDVAITQGSAQWARKCSNAGYSMARLRAQAA